MRASRASPTLTPYAKHSRFHPGIMATLWSQQLREAYLGAGKKKGGGPPFRDDPPKRDKQAHMRLPPTVTSKPFEPVPSRVRSVNTSQ